MLPSERLITIVFRITGSVKGEMVHLHDVLSETHETRFVSEFQVFTPHATIYQAVFPKKHEQDVLHSLQHIASQAKEMEFAPEGVATKGRYVGIRFKKSREIERLHKDIVETLNPLREGCIKDVYKDVTEGFSKEEKENVSRWGYPYVMDLYSPHVTILALKNESDAADASRALTWDKSFFVRQMTVLVSGVDAQGMVFRTIHEFGLDGTA